MLAIYDASNGYVYVSNSNSANVSAVETWSAANFTETGLPNGTTWWVNLTGVRPFLPTPRTFPSSPGHGVHVLHWIK